MDYGAVVRAATERLASPPDYVMFYRDLDAGRAAFPPKALRAIRAVGATPIVSFELWPWHRRQGEHLSAINRGAHDDSLGRWAEAARDDGGRILFRFGFEMNGEWFSWSGDPEAYRSAWRRAHRIFDQAGATNVEWVWSPNVVSVPDTPENAMHLYYPGDDVVDWVALDGYNFGDHPEDGHRWLTFEEVFGPAIEDLAARYPGKPIMIAETGSAEGPAGAKARWIRDARRALERRPCVRAVIWFDLDKRREGERNWSLVSSPGVLQAFSEAFATRR
jgi:hypothetical protein